MYTYCSIVHMDIINMYIVNYEEMFQIKIYKISWRGFFAVFS